MAVSLVWEEHPGVVVPCETMYTLLLSQEYGSPPEYLKAEYTYTFTSSRSSLIGTSSNRSEILVHMKGYLFQELSDAQIMFLISANLSHA